jgi:hypothetical protein
MSPGVADEPQRLNRFAFGAMKATCRRLYRLQYDSNPCTAINQPTAAVFVIRAGNPGSTAMNDAWELYQPADQEEKGTVMMTTGNDRLTAQSDLQSSKQPS